MFDFIYEGFAGHGDDSLIGWLGFFITVIADVRKNVWRRREASSIFFLFFFLGRLFLGKIWEDRGAQG